jgi:hypothetical protein
MRGPSLVQRHLLRRGFICWLLARAVFAMALLLTMSPPWANGGLVGLGVVALTAALGLIEVGRVRERVLLANLGMALPILVVMLAVPALLGEVALMALLP